MERGWYKSYWAKISWSLLCTPRKEGGLGSKRLTLKGRLSTTTRDGLLELGVISSGDCVLCHSGLESHNHLFFGWSYSASVWQDLFNKCEISRRPKILANAVNWAIKNCPKLQVKHSYYKICLAATVYAVRRERNTRTLRRQGMGSGRVSSNILADVRSSLCSWRKVEASEDNKRIWKEWRLSQKPFE